MSLSDTEYILTHLSLTEKGTGKLPIDHAFRLSNWKHLLHLEFHFTNVKLQNNQLLPKDKGRSYMIVRLPQQHIAEQSYDSKEKEITPEILNNWTAVTRIAGYSFIVFRIFLENNEGQESGMAVTEYNLLDWNNGERFALQIQQRGCDSPLINIPEANNTYPLGYQKTEDGEGKTQYHYSPSNFPSVNGDPTTLLEIPWRLLMSPKVPDQDRFEFYWEAPLVHHEKKHCLWRVTLILKEKVKIPGAAIKTAPKMELQMVGSPDYPNRDPVADNIFKYDASGAPLENGEILPNANDRRRLVELYIQYKLSTRTDKLTFSPLGVSTFLSFKNEKINETHTTNNLQSWSQLISFGRDEEVEVVDLILEKETGMKMLHVRTTKRVTRHGTFYLDYREYILPLDEFKDYQAHKSTTATNKKRSLNNNEETNKFRSPFKKIAFLEKKPKRIIPLTAETYYDETKFLKLDNKTKQGFYFPQVKLSTGEVKDITFEFIGTDWHDNEIRFKKNIQAITSEVNKYKPADKSVASIADEFFNKAENKTRNTIQLSRKTVGYAVKEKINSIIESAPSALPTTSILLQGKLKDLEGTIDFFDEYASLPQLTEAEVFVEAVSKLTGEDLPVKIKYAKDYLESQVTNKLAEGVNNLHNLVIQGNEAKVFAELLSESRNSIKGVIRNMTKEMGGFINPELPVEYLTYLKDNKRIPDELLKDLNLLDGKEIARVQDTYNDILLISDAARIQWKDTQEILPSGYFNALEAKILGSISLAEILRKEFEIPRLTSLPDKVVYNFITDKIQDLDAEFVKFYSKNLYSKEKAKLQIYFEKNTKSPQNSISFTRLANFSLGINIFSVEALVVNFTELKVSSTNTQQKKTEVKIDKVEFGGALKFLSSLAEEVNLPGTGLTILPSNQLIKIDYTFALPNIASPSFNFSNLKFDIGLNIPLSSSSSDEVKPISILFSINKPHDKFLITVGIFGGRGHFMVETTTKKLTRVEVSLEFGGYFGINLGIASGYVFLFAGIHYRYEEEGEMSVSAYLICGGGVTVFGFISVYVNFVMTLLYQSAGNYFEGSASVRYSIKIGFFKKSFTLSYRKRFAGNQTQSASRKISSRGLGCIETEAPSKPSKPAGIEKSFSEVYNKFQWNDYCETFSY